MTHPFDRYFAKHSHYPRIRIDNGAQKLTVEFARGYVHIRTSSPYSGEVYITRSTFFTLLPRLVPLARYWKKHPARDFDVPASMHAAYLAERDHSEALRAQKRVRRQHETLDDVDRRERQRQRFLRARARAARRAQS